MTCGEVDDLIEAVVAGDEQPSAAFRAHVEGCVRCAAAVARARRIDALLRDRPAPSAPPRFQGAVAARIRGARWESEQQIDRAFNVAVVLGLVAVVVGVAALFNLSALSAAGATVMSFLARPAPAAQVVPSASTYLLGSAFLGTALFVWWWAERRFSG